MEDDKKAGVALSDDMYLLQKSIRAATIKRIVDLDKIDWDAPFVEWKSGDEPPTLEQMEQYAVRKLYKYDKREEDDVVVFYDDIGILSGSKGYVLIRDGYVHGTYITVRS